MKKEQRDALVRLLEQYARLVMENTAMKALLITAEQHGAFLDYRGEGEHSTWERERDHLMATQIVGAMENALRPVLLAIEQAFRDSELNRLLSEIQIRGPIQ